MKIAGIIVGMLGAVLFVWHVVKVIQGTDSTTGYIGHEVLSLVGGILMFVGIWLYIIGRRGQGPKDKSS